MLPLLPATSLLVGVATTFSLSSFFSSSFSTTVTSVAKPVAAREGDHTGDTKGKSDRGGTSATSVRKRAIKNIISEVQPDDGGENDGKGLDNLEITIDSRSLSLASALLFLLGLLLLYSFIHSFFYGTLFAPLFAEIDYSVKDIIITALGHPYFSPTSSESFQEMQKFLRHFGLAL